MPPGDDVSLNVHWFVDDELFDTLVMVHAAPVQEFPATENCGAFRAADITVAGVPVKVFGRADRVVASVTAAARVAA